MRKGSDRARELSHPHTFGCASEALDVALHFGVPVGELETEGDRLGMNSVSSADLGCIFEFPGTLSQGLGEALQVSSNDLGGLPHQKRLCRIHNIVGGETVMEPARLRSDNLCYRGSECDYVVANLGLDFLNALQVEVGTLADGPSCVFRHQASFCQGFRCGHFYR